MLKTSDIKAYIPDNATSDVVAYLNSNKVKLVITKHRVTQLGTFSVDLKSNQITITINGTLSKCHFLLVLLHEFAHLEVHKLYKQRMKPHGKEWKACFSHLINDHVKAKHFPEDLFHELLIFATNPPASFNRKSKMAIALSKYDRPENAQLSIYAPLQDEEKSITLKDIPMGTIFTIKNGMTLKKIELPPRSRVRFLCVEIKTQRKYLVHANAAVTLL